MSFISNGQVPRRIPFGGCPKPYLQLNGGNAPRVKARISRQDNKQETVQYGNSWYEETRKAATSKRTAREEIGKGPFLVAPLRLTI